MKNVIGISLGAASLDFDCKTRLLDVDLRVRRLGTDGSLDRAEALLRRWDKRADAIALGLQRDSHRLDAPRLSATMPTLAARPNATLEPDARAAATARSATSWRSGPEL